MRVRIEWMDEEVRAYAGVEQAKVGTDHVLRLYGYSAVGRTECVAEIPIFGVREWKYEGKR